MSKICPKCGKSHEKPGTYCSRSCANSSGGTAATGKTATKACIKCGAPTVVRARTSASRVFCEVCSSSRKQAKLLANRKSCRICGLRFEDHIRTDVCKHAQLIENSLIKYFTFDSTTLGSTSVYAEWDRVKQLLYDLYIVQKNGSSVIEDSFNYPKSGNLVYKVLLQLGINPKSRHAAALDRMLWCGVPGNSPIYKNGWHKSWDGRDLYYRSSYELNYMKKLDAEKVEYYNDLITISYWDTQLHRYRLAFPDFYLPHLNKLVEIKSSYTYDATNMVDKEKEYRKLGYTFELRLDLDKE